MFSAPVACALNVFTPFKVTLPTVREALSIVKLIPFCASVNALAPSPKLNVRAAVDALIVILSASSLELSVWIWLRVILESNVAGGMAVLPTTSSLNSSVNISLVSISQLLVRLSAVKVLAPPPPSNVPVNWICVVSVSLSVKISSPAPPVSLLILTNSIPPLATSPLMVPSLMPSATVPVTESVPSKSPNTQLTVVVAALSKVSVVLLLEAEPEPALPI